MWVSQFQRLKLLPRVVEKPGVMEEVSGNSVGDGKGVMELQEESMQKGSMAQWKGYEFGTQADIQWQLSI